MIKKLRIKNFKCYGPQGADFNLSKVNFIYGDNSVGKSSFLQFLEQFVKQIDYKNQYDREQFDRFAFKGQGMVSARVRAVTETTNAPATYDLTFQPSLGNEWYETIAKEGVKISPEFWDSILPKNEGKDRIIHWPSPEDREKEGEGASPLESLGFLNSIQMEAVDEVGAVYIDYLLSSFGISYSCVKDKDGKIVRGLIHDNDFDIDVSVKDVGWGIQKIFDLAFALESWHSGILALEEPESNIDEAQLGALTRTLVEVALKCPNGQLIVECHSKLMVQKLAALVKEGVLPTTQDDNGVRVMVVSKHADGSHVEDAEIDDHGRIEWPTTFFGSEGEILRSMYGVGK